MRSRIRLGGMALANGVLVHGPTSWACAVRLDDGTLKVAARRKRLQATKVRNPLFRGPARIAEAVGLLPTVKRALPEAQLPFEVPRILNVRHGVLIVENLDLSALAADGVREFCLILTHPKLRGATGAWTSPIALV